MRNKRFRVIHNSGATINHLLSELGFTRKERQATDSKSQSLSTFVDVKRKEFWIVDQEALKQSELFVKEVYNEDVIEIEINSLQQ